MVKVAPHGKRALKAGLSPIIGNATLPVSTISLSAQASFSLAASRRHHPDSLIDVARECPL